jgi:competence ComEA-like helix-hairpin-helix protein
MNWPEPRVPTWRGRLALSCCVALLIFPLLAAAKKLPAHPIDLNTATLSQLEELPGVGPVTAQKILDFRKKSGPFKSVSDLLAIPRISKSRFAKIKPYVYVKLPAAKPKS